MGKINKIRIEALGIIIFRLKKIGKISKAEKKTIISDKKLDQGL